MRIHKNGEWVVKVISYFAHVEKCQEWRKKHCNNVNEIQIPSNRSVDLNVMVKQCIRTAFILLSCNKINENDEVSLGYIELGNETYSFGFVSNVSSFWR